MIDRTRKGGALAASLTAALAFSAVLAHASPQAGDTDDKYKPAGTQVTGTSTKTTFSVPGGSPIITVTCTHSAAGGKTPATGLGLFAINPLPVFNDGTGKPCKDSLGGTVTTTTSGAWKIGFVDKGSDETSAEPNSGDKLKIIIPQGGAVVKTSEGCTITVAPSGSFTVTGAYNDKSTLTVSIANLPVKTSGGSCPLPASTTSTFHATYVFSPGVSDAS
jgi:hypothetical protein